MADAFVYIGSLLLPHVPGLRYRGVARWYYLDLTPEEETKNTDGFGFIPAPARAEALRAKHPSCEILHCQLREGSLTTAEAHLRCGTIMGRLDDDELAELARIRCRGIHSTSGRLLGYDVAYFGFDFYSPLLHHTQAMGDYAGLLNCAGLFGEEAHAQAFRDYYLGRPDREYGEFFVYQLLTPSSRAELPA